MSASCLGAGLLPADERVEPAGERHGDDEEQRGGHGVRRQRALRVVDEPGPAQHVEDAEHAEGRPTTVTGCPPDYFAEDGFDEAEESAALIDALGFDWDTTEVKLPEYISFVGQKTATMRKLIELNHLQWFLKDTEDNGRIMSEPGFSIDLDSQSKDVIKETQDEEELGEWE